MLDSPHQTKSDFPCAKTVVCATRCDGALWEGKGRVIRCVSVGNWECPSGKSAAIVVVKVVFDERFRETDKT